MRLGMLCISLLADWLLFTFPLYQGLMELRDYEVLRSRYDEISKNVREVSPWWWLIFPIKIHLERIRARDILQAVSESKKIKADPISFIDKATAWYFVSVAGWLKMVDSAFDVLEELHFSRPLFSLIVSVLVLTFIGIVQIIYRISDRRLKRKKRELKNK